MFAKDLPTPSEGFIETIRYEAGQLHHIDLHEERMLRTLRAHWSTSATERRLCDEGLACILAPHLTHLTSHRRYKVRFVYDRNQIHPIEVSPYSVREISTIYLKHLPPLANYTYKRTDRRLLHVEGLAPDQEVIFVREGLLTDTRFSNIVLRLDGELVTPERPLLEGIMREHLLRSGRIRTAALGIEDWERAEDYWLINAMLPLEIE